MKHKNSLFRFLKIGFVLLLVYIVIAVCHFFVFSDKLTYDELVLVTEYYEEIRPVDKSIKSDFYVDTLLKVLDKKYISEELRKDSLTYSIYVANVSFKTFTETLNARTTAEYVSRCYLNFDDFVGLENSQELFDLLTSFYLDSNQEVADLETFATFMDEIVSREYFYLNGIASERNSALLYVGLSYVVVLLACYFVDFNKVIIKVKEYNSLKTRKQGGKK